MTATVSVPSIRSNRQPHAGDRFAGVRALVRKDLADWRHGRRRWVILGVVTSFMVLTAANNWIVTRLVAIVPGSEAPVGPMSMVPMDNLLAAVSTQIFLIAAIFASMNLIVAERERGTLSWVASKPVGRGGILTAKWLSGSVVIATTAAIVPIAITAIVVAAMYGAPGWLPVAVIAAGAVGAIVFVVAVAVAVSTAVTNQAAVAAIGFAALYLPGMIAALVPFDIMPFLPTSILAWAVGLAMGAEVGLATPIAWAVSILALGAFAVWRVDRLEL